MIPIRMIRKILNAYDFWRARRKIYRAMPELRDVDRRLRESRRAHKPVRAIMARRTELLHAELAREVRRA